jgi:hypothetical protein
MPQIDSLLKIFIFSLPWVKRKEVIKPQQPIIAVKKWGSLRKGLP